MTTPARILMVEGDTLPPAPTIGKVLLYAKTDDLFYTLNSMGIETPLGGVGGVTSIIAGTNVTISPPTGLGAVTINATAGAGGVTSIIAGTNVTISPPNGLGAVTINATGGGSGGSQPLNQVVYGTGTGVTSDPTLTYDSATGALDVGDIAPGRINAKPGQVLTINSDIRLRLTTADIDRLAILDTGVFLVNGFSGNPGNVLTSNGGGEPPSWQSPGGIEKVVFQYSPGASGDFGAIGAIISQTAGVVATITDTLNCIADYSFTGYSNPPVSIMIYAQITTSNTFVINTVQAAPVANRTVVGGGTFDNPNLINNIFLEENIITMQTRPADTGAVGEIGVGAFLMVVFKF